MTKISLKNGINLTTDTCYLVYDVLKTSAILSVHSDSTMTWLFLSNNEYDIATYELKTNWEYFELTDDEVLNHYLIPNL